MNNYVIYTDSGSDISLAVLKEWGVYSSCLTFKFDDETTEYSNNDMTADEFYEKMRRGGMAKTSAINVDTFLSGFEAILQEGKDILYLGFSTGLSTTANSAKIAAQQLSEKYPERKIIAIDTLCASAGQGLLVYLTLQKKNEGASIEEAAAFAKSLMLKICHEVTVDNLTYLKRGGRISPTVAVVGTVLGIKPLIYVDNDGKLVNSGKVRGRKKALAQLAARYGELAEDPANSTIFISHSDCLEDVQQLAKMIEEQYGATVNLITDIGPVIGAHTGPGTVAFFFVGKHR